MAFLGGNGKLEVELVTDLNINDSMVDISFRP